MLPSITPGACESANNELQGFADSLLEALDIDEDSALAEDAFEDMETRQPNLFRLNDRELALPTGSDFQSLAYRAEAIRADLERQLGMEKLIELRHELELRGDEGTLAQSIIHDVAPGLVCLAQQLAVLDERLEARAL
jgi:hypothetical protein